MAVSAPASVTEGDTITFTFTRTGETTTAREVHFSLHAVGSRFHLGDALGDKTVTISAGETTATYEFPTIDGSTFQEIPSAAPSRLLTASVDDSEGNPLGPPGLATTRVRDNDQRLSIEITVPAGGLRVPESASTSAVGLVATTTTAGQPSSPRYFSLVSMETTGEQAAQSGVDYRPLSVAVELPESDWTQIVVEGETRYRTSTTVEFQPVDDSINEPDELLYLELQKEPRDNLHDFVDFRVEVTIVDDDVPGVTLSEVEDLTTTEAGGTATFKLRLDTEPFADVIVTPASSDTTEGTVSAALTFTAADWDMDGVVTVTGQDDDLQDGDVDYEIQFALSSTDTDYNGLTVTSAAVTNSDNEPAPEFSLSVVPESIEENGGVATVTVTAKAASATERTIDLSVDGTAVSGTDYTIAPLALSLAANETSTVTTVTGVDDDRNEDAETVRITAMHSTSVIGTVVVTIDDDDVPGVTLSEAEGLTTTEAGGTATFKVRLDTEPSGDVTVTPTSGDTTEGTVSGALTLTAVNWATGGVITVTGQDDDLLDGNVGYEIQLALSSTDPDYNGLTVPGVAVTNTDDEPVDFTLSVAPASIGENGGVATVTVTAKAASATERAIALSVAGTAVSGTDYNIASLALSLAANETSTVTTVTGLDDDRNEDAETVRITAMHGTSVIGTVVVTIVDDDEATQGPPVAVDDAVETNEDTAVVIAVLENDSDPDGDALTVNEVTAPGHGAARLTDAGTVEYSPEADYFGTDRFAYVVRDGSGLTARAEVTVTVRPVNDPPRAVDDTAVTMEDKMVVIATLENDRDPDGEPLSIRELSVPAHGDARLTEVSTVEYTPEPDYHGTDRFTYLAEDGLGLTARAQVTVTVRPANDLPVAIDDTAVTNEDTAVSIAVLENDSDPDGDALTVKEVSAPGHGAARLTDVGTVDYSPRTDYYGTDRFTYVVEDGAGLTVEAAVAVTVRPVNDPPVAVDDTAETTEDTMVTIAVLENDSDPDGDALTVRKVSTPAHGVARLTEAGTVEYMPEPQYHGTDRFTYVGTDGSGLTARAAVTVTVLPANDPPQAVGVIPDQTLEAGDGPTSLDLSPYFEDRDGDLLTYTAVASQPTVALSLAGSTLTLAVERLGAAMVTVTAQDPGSLTATQAFMVTTTDRQARGVLEDTLAAVGRAHLASARATLGRRAAATGHAESQVGRTDFLLALGGRAGDGSERGRRWTVWGQFDVQAFRGERSSSARYDGDLQTAYIGVDTRVGERWLAGVALARSRADGDWSFGSAPGRLTTRLTSVQPYLRWSEGATSIWATAGGGRGSAENERIRYGLQEQSDLGLRLGLVEVRRQLADVGPGIELALRGDASWARLATAAGAELIDALEVDVHQFRVGVDVSRSLRTAGGIHVEPFGEVHARHDGGSGQTGAGLEVAGGLRVSRGIFRVESIGRLLALHAADGYREHGAAVTLSVGEGARQPGLTLSLSPRWGAPASAGDALWRDDLLHRRTPGAAGAGSNERALDARVGYGLQLPSGGLLTPFGVYGRSQYGRRLQVGLLLDRMGPVELKVSGERSAAQLRPGRAQYRMSVSGSVTLGGRSSKQADAGAGATGNGPSAARR